MHLVIDTPDNLEKAVFLISGADLFLSLGHSLFKYYVKIIISVQSILKIVAMVWSMTIEMGIANAKIHSMWEKCHNWLLEYLSHYYISELDYILIQKYIQFSECH